MQHQDAYIAGFCKAAEVAGVDPVALYKKTAALQKKAIDFRLAKRVAQRFASGRWNSDTAKKLMARILMNPPRGDIDHFGALEPEMQRKILSQVRLTPGMRQYLSGLGTMLRHLYRPTARGARNNEFLMLLSDLAERPKLHANAVANAKSLPGAMTAVKRTVPTDWKDMRSASERLFDALARG
jgi:hypothetical protein